MRDQFIATLRKMVGEESVLTEPAELRTYDCDAYTLDKARPAAVVLPDSTEEVAQIVRLCNQYKVYFVARGAGTGLSGGAMAMADGIIIETARMNRILEVDWVNRRVVAQAGCVNLAVSRAVAEDGLHFAPDPSSQGVSTIGGNVSENSGGPHTLKYGVTTNHVTGIKLVLPSGEVADLGGKCEVCNGYDLVGLITGSEGTLGVITEVTLKLTPLPVSVRTMLAIFDSVDSATQTVSDIIAAGIIPAAIEMMDATITLAVEQAFHMGFPLDAGALLLIEVDGAEAGLDEDADAVAAICQRNGAREIRRAADSKERDLLWKARKKGVGAAGRLAPSVVTQDGVIPRSKLPEVFREITAIASRNQVRIGNVFHAGDGNLHPCVMFDERDAEEVKRVLQANKEILELCIKVGGSITGEHGVGIEKVNFMPLLFSPVDLALMERIRSVFNPDDLCNPGKLLPTSKSCIETKWRPKAAAI